MIALPLLGTACLSSDPVDVDCLDDQNFAVNVSFHDSVTRVRLTGPTPGMIQDGAYRDSLQARGVDGAGRVAQMAAGFERSGTYTLTAKRDGYRAYT